MIMVIAGIYLIVFSKKYNNLVDKLNENNKLILEQDKIIAGYVSGTVTENGVMKYKSVRKPGTVMFADNPNVSEKKEDDFEKLFCDCGRQINVRKSLSGHVFRHPGEHAAVSRMICNGCKETIHYSQLLPF